MRIITLLLFLPLCSLADTSLEVLDRMRSAVNDIANGSSTALSAVRKASHNLIISRSVDDGGMVDYPSLLSRLDSLRVSIGNIVAYSSAVSNRLSTATYPLPEYQYDVDAVRSAAVQSLDPTLESYLEYIALAVDSVNSSVKAGFGDVNNSLNVALPSISADVNHIANAVSALTMYCKSSDGYRVELTDSQMGKINQVGEDIVDAVEAMKRAVVEALKQGFGSGGDGSDGSESGISHANDTLLKINGSLVDIQNLIAQWYGDWKQFATNIDISVIKDFYEKWSGTFDTDLDYYTTKESMRGIPIVRVLGNFGSSSNGLEYTEKYYHENYDDLEWVAKKLGNSEDGFKKLMTPLAGAYPPFQENFAFAAFGSSYDSTTTNNPFVSFKGLYAYDGISQIVEILYNNLLVNGQMTLIGAELLKRMPSTFDSEAADDEYTTGLSDLENEYGDDTKWESHFTNTVGVIEGFRDKFSGKVDTAVIDTISDGFIASDAPNALQFKVPSYSYGTFATDTMFFSSPDLGEYSWLLDGIRNFSIFIWWSGAVTFVYSLARVLLSALSKFIGDPVSTIVQRD